MPEGGSLAALARILAGDSERLQAEDLIATVLAPGGVPGAESVSRLLLDRFGGLSRLKRAEPGELLACEGIAPASAARLLACFALLRRCQRERESIVAAVISGPEDVAALLAPEMEGLCQEQFRVLLLDSKHRVRRHVLVAQGGLNAAIVHPREVLRPAILSAAAALVLAHNHPSGDPEPSDEDLRLTARFGEACRLMGIELLDHVILGDGEYTSLKERGLIA